MENFTGKVISYEFMKHAREHARKDHASKLILSHSVNVETCADLESFVRGGLNLTIFFS